MNDNTLKTRLAIAILLITLFIEPFEGPLVVVLIVSDYQLLQ